MIPDNFSEFRKRFFALCVERLPASCDPKLQLDGSLELPELTNMFVEQLDRLQPFGEGNPEPTFSVKTPELPFKRLKEKHVKWEVNGNVEIIGWNRANTFAEKPPSRLAVNLGFNEFRGRRKIQLTIQDSRV